MKSPFEDMGEEDSLTEIEFTLSVFCSQDGTLNVTTNDLNLDPSHPEVRPIGVCLPAQQSQSRLPMHACHALNRIGCCRLQGHQQ